MSNPLMDLYNKISDEDWELLGLAMIYEVYRLASIKPRLDYLLENLSRREKMTYKQLLDILDGMSDAQLEMTVTVFVDDCYHALSAVLHVDKDFRQPDEEFQPYPEDQPILL